MSNRLERSNMANTIIWWNIIYCHSTPLTEPYVRILLYALVCTILCTEIQCCSPVIAAHVSNLFKWRSTWFKFMKSPAISSQPSPLLPETYLKSSLNVQVVQVLFSTRSCLSGFISGLKLLPPTIWCVCGLPTTPGFTKGSRRSTVSCEHAKRIIAAPRVTFWACSPLEKASTLIMKNFMMIIAKGAIFASEDSGRTKSCESKHMYVHFDDGVWMWGVITAVSPSSYHITSA